jgi:hypothetical protein
MHSRGNGKGRCFHHACFRLPRRRIQHNLGREAHGIFDFYNAWVSPARGEPIHGRANGDCEEVPQRRAKLHGLFAFGSCLWDCGSEGSDLCTASRTRGKVCRLLEWGHVCSIVIEAVWPVSHCLHRLGIMYDYIHPVLYETHQPSSCFEITTQFPAKRYSRAYGVYACFRLYEAREMSLDSVLVSVAGQIHHPCSEMSLPFEINTNNVHFPIVSYLRMSDSTIKMGSR